MMHDGLMKALENILVFTVQNEYTLKYVALGTPTPCSIGNGY
jgi:hypothetical protein